MSTLTSIPRQPQFRKEDIDEAIVMTLADLGGFFHPIGVRLTKGADLKHFMAIPHNLINRAAGHNSKLGPPILNCDPTESYESHLTTCRHFAASCHGYQRFAVQELILIMMRDNRERNKNSSTHPPQLPGLLTNNHPYETSVEALAVAFGVPTPTMEDPHFIDQAPAGIQEQRL